MTAEALSDAELRRIVEALYAATAVGDWESAEVHLADDLVIQEAESLPYGGYYRGRQALRALFEKVMQFWDEPSIDMHAITTGQGHAVGILTLNVTSRASGRRIGLEIAEMFRFREDKVIEIKPYYFDTHMIVEDGRG